MAKKAAIRIVIESKIENVFLVGLAVNKICSHLDLDDTEASRMEVCIVEAVTNSIRHSYRGAPGREVTLTVTVLEDRVEFQICDQGASIPPEKLEKPRLKFDPRDIKSLPEGGMGIYLMHQIMDDVRYVRGDGKNTLTLVKSLVPHLA